MLPTLLHLRRRMARNGLFLTAIVVALAATAPSVRATEVPPWLPRYDLTIRVEPQQRTIKVVERVTWTNRHQRPAHELVFNAHARYSIPDDEVGLIAKTVELLRVAPKEALTFDGPALNVQSVRIANPGRQDIALIHRQEAATRLDFTYPSDNPTSLVVPLPRTVAK